MSTEPEPRWRRLEPDARREQIFTCAAELFGERPYASVSTSDIAARAGVARGLINHYFGTKRELYLAVVRRALTVSHDAVDQLPDGTLDERIDAAVEWFLTMVARQEKMWLTAITPEGIGRDPDMERILDEVDQTAAARVLDAMGFSPDSTAAGRWERQVTLVRAYGGLVKAAGQEWLVRGTLDRGQVQLLLANQLRALVTDVLPQA